jgi:predicted  nucleic acid-binding Zn-ribbon protein
MELEDLRKEIEDLKRDLAAACEHSSSWKNLAQSRGKKIRGLQESNISLSTRIKRLKTTLPPAAPEK